MHAISSSYFLLHWIILWSYPQYLAEVYCHILEVRSPVCVLHHHHESLVQGPMFCSPLDLHHPHHLLFQLYVVWLKRKNKQPRLGKTQDTVKLNTQELEKKEKKYWTLFRKVSENPNEFCCQKKEAGPYLQYIYIYLPTFCFMVVGSVSV